MTGEKLAQMEAFIAQVEGNVMHVKRVLHISKLLAMQEHLAYDEDVLSFAAYFHDISAYPPYAPKRAIDHALESSKMMPETARAFGMNEDSIPAIVEAVRYHDKANMGARVETRLIRNADGLDYLGCMAVARDFAKHPKDMRKAMDALRKRKEMFLPLIDLECAKALAAPRVIELDQFIERFEQESFAIY